MLYKLEFCCHLNGTTSTVMLKVNSTFYIVTELLLQWNDLHEISQIVIYFIICYFHIQDSSAEVEL